MENTRKKALAAGDRHYFTSKQCPKGHIDVRFASTGACKTCCRERAFAQHINISGRIRKHWDTDIFVEAAKKLQGNKYDYSRVVYKAHKVKIEVVCPQHGSFFITPDNFLHGKGCSRCGDVQTGERCTHTTEKFIALANAVWGERWDYSSSVYEGSHKRIGITCRVHGVFLQTPTNHLTGKNACPQCNHTASKGEDAVATFLSKFTLVVRRDRTILKPKELDIYLPEHKLAVEYCGMYWHSYFNAEDEASRKRGHAFKYQECAKQGIRLITLYETEWQQHELQIKRLLRNAIGKSKGKLMARKCQLASVPIKQARDFYNKYHPQGGSGTGDHYGLYHHEKLVACMRFTFGGNDRGTGAASRCWTLSRYATRVSVAGAASRLFKAFLTDKHPQEVKSFSDNRFFGGGMYQQLGFVLEAEIAPDYAVWSKLLGLRPKSHYQRRLLPTRLLDHGMTDIFDPETDPRTEAQMTYLMECGRIFDCGKKRWVWTANNV